MKHDLCLGHFGAGCGVYNEYAAAAHIPASCSRMSVAQVLTDFEHLPEDVRDKLAELDLELSEGKLVPKEGMDPYLLKVPVKFFP